MDRMKSFSHTPTDHCNLVTEVHCLSRLLEETTSSNSTWTSQDYGPILQHQLNAPLGADISLLIANPEHIMDTPLSIRTFGDLLLHPNPPIPALRLVKDFAKQLSQNAQYAYPRPVATVLYYASIVAALVRSSTLITELPHKELIKGIRWVHKQSWISPPLQRLFDDAMDGTTIRQRID